LGDTNAIKTAYPKAQQKILNKYVQDTICGTWELLNEAINPNKDIRPSKIEWAEKITPYIVIEENKSPSFQYFVKTVKDVQKLA
jgi:hypothetical protein